MPTRRLDVLYEDNHLLVVNKPAGIATMGAEAGEPSLVQSAKSYLKRRYDKPGNVYLGVVSRLDKVATGAIVFARTSKAARRLTQQQKDRLISRRYWCLVSKLPGGAPSGRLEDWLVKRDELRRMVTVAPGARSAQHALLEFRVVREARRGYLLEVQLFSGRKHQIRVQLASRGCPIWGDRKYGSDERFPEGIALHSRQLSLVHPVRGETMTWQAALPDYWPPF